MVFEQQVLHFARQAGGQRDEAFAVSRKQFFIHTEINIGVSVRKGNTILKDAIDSYLKDKNADDFNALMAEAIKIQPLSE